MVWKKQVTKEKIFLHISIVFFCKKIDNENYKKEDVVKKNVKSLAISVMLSMGLFLGGCIEHEQDSFNESAVSDNSEVEAVQERASAVVSFEDLERITAREAKEKESLDNGHVVKNSCSEQSTVDKAVFF